MKKAIAGVAAAAVIACFLYVHRDWPLCWRLQRQGVATTGWVIGKSDAKQRRVYYAFSARQKIYTETGEGGYGNPSFGGLSEGDKVTVYYLPSDPAVSMLGLPEERLLRQHAAMAWTLLLAGAVVAWVFRREIRRQAP